MASVPPTLMVTDGTDAGTVSFFEDLQLKSWTQAVLGYKQGGYWQDPPLDDGRRLAMTRYANVEDRFTFSVRSGSQNTVIERLHRLQEILQKAVDYWTADHQDEPVWLEAQADCEANPRRALVHGYSMPSLPSPFEGAFLADEPAMDEIEVTIHHAPWQDTVPGTIAGACVQAGGQQTWDIIEWAINTGVPVDTYAIIALSTGWMVAGDNAQARRTNNGTVWNNAAAPPTGTCRGLAELGAYIYCISNTGVFRSADNGDNWVNRTANWIRSNANAFGSGLLAGADGYLYAVADGTGGGTGVGIHRSNDGGASFTNVQRFWDERGGIGQLPTGTFLASGFDPGGTGASAIYRSTDGVNWYIVHNLPADHLAQGFAESGGVIVAAVGDATITTGGYAYVSTDDGLTWVQAWDFGTDVFQVIALSRGGFLAVGNDFVAYGSASGTDWKTHGLTGTPILYDATEFSVTGLAYAAGDDDVWEESRSQLTLGRAATCDDEAFLANKQNIAQVTDVFVYDAAPVTWTAQLPAGAFPFDLLPDPFALGDMVYFGIDSSVLDSGPFNNLVFDIGTPLVVSGTSTIRWEYYNGAAWTTLTVQDGTASLFPFEIIGVNSVHWVPPSDWATTAVNGVTGWWVRVNVVALGTHIQTPTQQSRDVYTVTWAGLEFDEAQIGGNIPALLRFLLRNRSDVDGPGGSAPDAWANRVFCGTRKTSRGAAFVSYLNCADEQNPIGVAITLAAATTFQDDIEAPSGRAARHQQTGTSTWADQVTFTLDPSIARDFYGKFRCFVRAYQAAGSAGDVRVRLQARTGSGGLLMTTDHAVFDGVGANYDWQALDMGQVELPPAGLMTSSELGDEMAFVIQVWSSVGTNYTWFYDLVLIPVDEWSGDFVDQALTTESGLENGYSLDVDAITLPKAWETRALVRTSNALHLVRSKWQSRAVVDAVLQANADQRLHFLAFRCDTANDRWYSEPWLAHSLQVWRVARYKAMRGAR